MSPVYKLVATTLKGTGKQGILKPDGKGYFRTMLGALNSVNSVGEYYVAQGAIHLFDKSALLQRRALAGNLKGENGHPKAESGWTEQQIMARMMRVEETRISHHIRLIELDFEFGKKHPQYNNPSMVGIIGEVTPAGPYAEAMERSFLNPEENTCFSVRGLTDNFYERGQCYRTLLSVNTFDWVTENGMKVANKWHSPALESADIVVTSRRLEQALSVLPPEYALESGDSYIQDVRSRILVPQSRATIDQRWK